MRKVHQCAKAKPAAPPRCGAVTAGLPSPSIGRTTLFIHTICRVSNPQAGALFPARQTKVPHNNASFGDASFGIGTPAGLKICSSILVVARPLGLKLGEQLPNAIWNFFFAFELVAQDAADRP